MLKLPSWNKRANDSTRGRIIASLRRSNRTVNDLAEELRITDNAVRVHLATLERDGLVELSGTRPGVRKPHLIYSLTNQAEQLFPRAYAPILQELLTVLSARLPSESVQEILNEVAHRMAQANALPGASAEERIQQALEILSLLGGLAEVQHPEGRTVIQAFGCPLTDIVKGHPEACQMVASFLSELIGVPVRELCHRGVSPKCAFELV